MSLKDKFAEANTTLDGRLTKEQADTAGMKQLAKNFDTIDTDKVGYITLDQVRTFRNEKPGPKAGAGGAGPKAGGKGKGKKAESEG